jgi:hypothetical protein
MRRIKWPGEAAVVIATVHIHKGPLTGPYLLDDRPVERLTAFLFHAGADSDPAKLAANANKSFVGSVVLGMGFTFDDHNLPKGSTPIAEMHHLIEQDPRNAERIFPYIGGEEVNTSPTHAHHRYVINFEDMSEDEARRWPDLMAIVEEKVKQERTRLKDNPDGRRRKTHWWLWGRYTPALFQAIKSLDQVLLVPRTSKQLSLALLPPRLVFSENTVVFTFCSLGSFATLQCRVHETWVRFTSSTLEDRLGYRPSDCFETFPFPPDFERDPGLEAAGEAYYRFRAELMVARDKGLTKTYNDFHDRRPQNDPEIRQLRELHHAMDQAVLRAYGWDDLAEAARPVFLDEENEDEFAYQGRLFWPSDFRDEVLARLLALNAERHADEVRRGVAPRQSARGQATEGDAEDEEDAA